MEIEKGIAVPYGSSWLIETAARIEDRLRRNDLDLTRIPFQQQYDFLWIYGLAIGLPNVLYVLVAIDLALNPFMPLANLHAQKFSFESTFASIRFKMIINSFYIWLESKQLPDNPSDRNGVWDRGELDSFYLKIEDMICQKFKWLKSVEALEELLNSINSWSEYGIELDAIKYSLELRKLHPSIFACQTMSNILNKFSVRFPPYLFRYSDGGFSTIKDPKKGTKENIELIKQSIVEQLICDNDTYDYFCPLCTKSLISEDHVSGCEAKDYWQMLNLSFSDFKLYK